MKRVGHIDVQLLRIHSSSIRIPQHATSKRKTSPALRQEACSDLYAHSLSEDQR